MDIVNTTMILSDWVVRHWKLKELDREDAQKRPAWIVLGMTCKV